MPAFPYKLHTLLEDVTADEELSTIISWLPDGKSFRIHSQEEFERRVLKDYFPRQKQVKSFMRQLQYYDFENFGDGLFCHRCFRRGQRNLCGQILHQLPTKSQKVGGGSTRPLKQRGRKKKGRSSQSFETSPELDMAPYIVASSSPEPSLPDDATSTRVVCSSSSVSADEQQQSQEHQGRELQLNSLSPTCVNEVPSPLKRSGSNVVKGNAQTEQLFNTVLPNVFPQQTTSSYLTTRRGAFAQYGMQAMTAARSNYMSCLQQEIMIGSILSIQRRLSMEQYETTNSGAINNSSASTRTQP
ncbi:unnamed protein product [Cylindrotheca closterium]|uniref:HSF-type DNA-binding domain-containing protein n=1 Tax=Cylindrotheca closterium TaxID=2856 RepID=A0AAD2G162_9STRA|nr:unnamed protein product [Cylindrotheca closterium]